MTTPPARPTPRQSRAAEADAQAWASITDRKWDPDSYRGVELGPRFVRFKKLRPNTPTPTRGDPQASGLDLSAMAFRYHNGRDVDCDHVVLQPRERILCLTGIAIELPNGFEAQVRGRSGNTLKRGLVVPTGTIDASYRGEIGVLVVNNSLEAQRIEVGVRVGQLVIAPVALPELVEVAELGQTERGANGWGSTGDRSGGL